MDQNLLPDIFAFLAKNRPELGTPNIIFLGGSQVLNNGIHKTKDSDYDILILFPNVTCAESFSFTSEDGQRTYDLMLRDPSTFAYDIEQSLQVGKGTLLHIASYGAAIFDPKNIAPDIQKSLKQIYDKGPHIFDINGVQDEIHTLQWNLFGIPKNDAYAASLVAICNRIAIHALRFSGNWTSTGKIAGRFLKYAMPEFSMSLRAAFDTARITGNERAIAPFLDKHLPLLYFHFNGFGRNFTNPHSPYPYSTNPTDIGEASTAARMNLNALAHYLKSDNRCAQDAAITWAHVKLENVMKALSAERFDKKPEEYFLALGRAISSIADVNAAHTTDFPTNAAMVRRISMLFAQEPAFADAFDKALHGDSSQLKTLSDSILSNIGGSPLPNLYRPSRQDMRAYPTDLIRDFHVQ